jgi:hypothetical protein
MKKSEVRISKFETMSKFKIIMTKTSFEFLLFYIRICFEFRISDFEF